MSSVWWKIVSSSHRSAKFQSLSYSELEGAQNLLKDFAKTKRCPRDQSEPFSTNCPIHQAMNSAACSTHPKVRAAINEKRKPPSFFKKQTFFFFVLYNKHRSFQRNHWKTHSLSFPSRENTREEKQSPIPLAGSWQREWPDLGSSLIPEEGCTHPLLVVCRRGTKGMLRPNGLFSHCEYSSFSFLKECGKKNEEKVEKKGK